VWVIDFQFDQAISGRQVELLNIIDEFTRETLAMHVATSINADDTVRVLDRLARERGAPGHVRCDNGPDLTAHTLRDWCRFLKAESAFIEPATFAATWALPADALRPGAAALALRASLRGLVVHGATSDLVPGGFGAQGMQQPAGGDLHDRDGGQQLRDARPATGRRRGGSTGPERRSVRRAATEVKIPGWRPASRSSPVPRPDHRVDEPHA